ncbi:phosphoesterase [Defluviimonas sp. 20V17]|uniref:Undecaprenyl-diphosphatase n=1 Tax=Allgaiera indica TaxID=765699 RepID=A0AAN5A080_9RHOB|nr:phosphatase PAP2 family protein [Allgaiera indica]KDB02273.1 phosphoesterase [Defluviimonas sp. 20V17]GHE02844.1 undecaprenyl-diphosphatase BcrC [Allgaiera indica]SDX16911.1 undecaprenyl-diphosphatase [Allgaiera indica]
MDAAITHWINSFAGQTPLLDPMMVAITQVGVPIIVLLVVVQWWVREDRTHVRHVAICAGLAFLLGLAINQGVLLFIHRVRPYDAGVSHLLIAKSADWSFPSDHATASMSVAMAFALQGLPRRALAFFAMAFLVCLSRVYVGTHYVTDVLGGTATGFLGAIIVRLLYRENTRLDRFATSIL